MANVNELRNKFPSLRNMTDYEIVDLYAKKNGVSPDIVAYDLGVQPKNAPGFTTGLKNSMYGLAQGLGQVANDMYGENSKSPAMRDMAQQLETYGREGMQRNPVTIMDGDGNALQNIGQNLLERPINTVAQIGGAAAGLVLPAAGLKGAVYAARGAQALGTAGKAGLAAGEIATYGTSSYGNMRNSQEEQGANTLEDKLKAAGSALASGAIERFGGVEALVAGKGKASKTLLGTTVKAGGKEAGEEIVQTPIERYGSNKEVFDDTLATDALAGGVAGFIGGAMSGPIEHYTKKPPVNDYEPFQIVGTSADADVRKKVDVTDNIVPASGESLVNTINRTVGVRPTGKPDKNYAKGFMTAYNELSGVRTVDPTTQQERELTVGELFARRAGVSETAEQAPDAASNISQAESAGLQPKAQAKPINLPQAAPWEYKTPEGEAIPTPEFVGATSQKKREAYTTVAEARQQGIIDNNKFEELANSIAQTNKIGKVVNQIKAEIDNIKSWAVPVRPENPTPEAAEQYRQQMESFLTRDLTDVQRADLIAAVGVRKTQEDGTEDAVGHSLRAVAKARGASHTAVAKNVAKAFESIQKRMEAAGIDSDQAMVFLNMDKDAVADVASISTAQAVQAGLAFRNNDYQQPKAVYAESDDRPDYTGEMTAAPAEENFTDVTGAQFGVEPQAQATSNGKRVDAEELADGPELAQDADVEFEDQAGAALAAREAEGEVVEAPEAELSQQLRDWRGAPIPEADVLDAADTFNDRAGPDGEAFATLDKDVQNQYIKAYVAFMDGQISDHRFERIFAEIVDEQYRRQTTVKEAETGAVQSEPATGETGTTGQAASSKVGNADQNSEVSVGRTETQERGTDGAEVAKDTVAAEDMADLLTALKKLSAKGSKHASNAKSYLAQVNSGEDVYMEAKAWVEAVTADDSIPVEKKTSAKPLVDDKIKSELTAKELDVVKSDPQLGNGNLEAGFEKLKTYVAKALAGDKLSHLKKAVRDIVTKIQNGVMSFMVAFNFSANTPVELVKAPLATYAKPAYSKQVTTGEFAISDSAKSVATHTLNTGNGKAFLVVDKPNAMLYAFSADGALLNKTPVLTGKSIADVAPESATGKNLDNYTDAEKVTPAGKFTGKFTYSADYGSIIALDETNDGSSLIAVHRTYLGTPSENRAGRLASPTTADNRISYGCVNVPSAFYDSVIAPNYVGESQVIVMPDKSDAKKFFGVAESKIETYKTGVVSKRSYDKSIVGTKESVQPQQKVAGAKTLQFSKATPTKGTTVESIEAVVESVSGKGYNPKVRIYKTAAEAVADGHLSKEEAKGTQGWVNGLGHAYFIAENIKPGNELAVFLHEVGAHLGIENLLNDKEYENLFKKIMDWAASDDGSLESRIALAAVNRVEKAVTNDADYAPETIAYFIEEAVKAGVNPIAVEYKTALGRWMAVLMHALKIALKRLGVDLNKLSARDVVNLAYGAAHLELNGGAKVESPDVIEGNRYSKVVDAVPEEFREPAENVVSLLKDKASSTINLVGMTSDLIDAAVKRGLKSAEKWKNLIDERQAERNRNEKEIDNIIQDMDKLDAQRQAAVWSAARDMSKSGKWGYKPTWRPDVEVDAAAAEIYNKLSKDEQVLLDRVFHNGDRSLKEVQSILDEILRDEFDAKMKRATPAQKANVEKEFEKYRKLFGRKLTQLSGPYTPLQGVGSHITVAKSQRYIDVESSGGDLSELRQDPNHFVMVFTKSQVAADAKKRELARRGFDAVNITAKPKREWLSQSDSIPFEAFDKLRKLAANNTSKMSENLNNLITDLYLTSLAETSSRKSEMRREGVLELSPEAVSQAFIARGRAHAHYVSVLKKGKDIADAFADMDAEARNSTDPEVTKYLNEFAKRYANATRFDDSPVVDKLMGFNSVWMLLTKPAYYLYNMTQPFVMSQPLLASKFGYGKASEAMLAAYQDVLKNKAGLRHPEALPEDVRGAALKLREMGKLDFGMSQDLGSRVSTGNSAASHVVNKVERALRNAAQASEALNRTVTGITAYRLALKSGMSDADAIKYAAKVIDRTQGDYSNFNAPRLFNSSPVARLLTQFRKFQVIQATFIIKNVMDAFKGATPAERAAARATLKYVFGHYAVLAGTLGLPMANVIAYAFNAMDGDDDDDKQDLELQARKALGNGFFADLVLRGAPAAVFNINMSDNVGAGNAFALFPYGEVDMSSRSGYERALVTALGPTAGNGYQVVAALNKLEQGDYYQFSEALMPSGFKAAMKSLREASTGVTNTKGDTLVTPDEVALWDTVVKLVGGKTQSDSVRNLVRGQKYEFERFFKDRGSLIKHQYVKAYRDGDSEGMADARRRWQALQGFKREHGFKADPMSRLFKSIKDANDRNNDMVDGVEVTDRNRGFVEQYTEVTD